MKQLMIMIFLIIWLMVNTSHATVNHSINQLKINMQFHSKPNKDFFNQPVFMEKTIQIDPILNKPTIISTQSTLMNNLPVTIAMLLKITKINNDQITLHFDLMSYGFSKSGTLIAEPQMILKNNQLGEMQAGPYKLNVIANWSK